MEREKTRTKLKIVNGYALLNSILLVIAAIQNNEATKADKKPERIYGSNNSFSRKVILFKK